MREGEDAEEEMRCEYCGKDYENNINLLFCYSRHFETELVTMCTKLLQKTRQDKQQGGAPWCCPWCGPKETFPSVQELALHLGSVHLLVNDVLIREGIYPKIPSAEEFEEYFDEIEE